MSRRQAVSFAFLAGLCSSVAFPGGRPVDRPLTLEHVRWSSGTRRITITEERTVGQPCPFSRRDTIAFDASHLTQLSIDVPAGSIVITGSVEGDSVRIDGVHCAPSKAIDTSLRLAVGHQGAEASIKEQVPRQLFSQTQGSSALINLAIRMPQRLALRIENGIGTVKLQDVGSVWLHDALDDARITGVQGDVDVQSGPGNLEISSVGGGVHVRKSVGFIRIAHVDGVVDIGRDHAGNVDIRDVKGSVNIQEGQKGDVSVSNIGGDLTMGPMRAGNVSHSDVRGTVRIPRH